MTTTFAEPIEEKNYKMYTAYPELVGKKFYKITNSTECHYGFQYGDGLNILTEPFAETGTCCKGGFYFTDIDHIADFFSFGVYLRIVELPLTDPEFKCVKDDNNKWRANRIILKEKMNLYEYSTYQFLIRNGLVVTEFLKSWIIDISIINCDKIDLNMMKIIIENCKISPKNTFHYLTKAAHYGRIEIIKQIGENYINISDSINNALYEACKNGHLDIVKYLVKHGASIKSNHHYALRVATRKGKLEVVKYLVENGANVNIKDDYCIGIAAKKGYFELVKYLLEKGTNIRTKNTNAIRFANDNGHKDIFDYLIKINN